MQSFEFDKHRLINAFPSHVRDECLRAYESERQKHARVKEQSVSAYRDAHAEEIWEDVHQKAEWTYKRAQDDG